MIVTRFAPSPTGFLHIGGARTALFNFLYAKRHGGRFLLRIEDTDKKRSTTEAKDAIIESLQWLDINWDGDIIYQSERPNRYKEVALKLLESGKAYKCFTKQDEISKQREEAIKNKESFIFNSPWRNRTAENYSDYPKNEDFVIRLKTPNEGEIVVKDQLQGDVIVHNSHIDDMILLRSDGTSTYMLAVVVDDHDMGITHIIRGDDHLSNAARQQMIYQAMGWDIPEMVHIPLIHGPDGAKLSKRHGALGANQYKDMGYLPEAICNYLLRLGWSHGDDEYISREQALEWFNIENIGKSPARLDFDKMRNMNAFYIRNIPDEEIFKIILKHFDCAKNDIEVNDISKENIRKAIKDIKPRAEMVGDLADIAMLYLDKAKISISEKAQEIIDECDEDLTQDLIKFFEGLSNDAMENIDSAEIQAHMKIFAKEKGLKLGVFMKYVRAMLTGQKDAPSMFNMISIIGLEETIRRINTSCEYSDRT